MAEKVNHHYIPRCYLRGFTLEGEKSLIWEYDKINETISRQPKSIRDVCSEDYYYAQETADGDIEHRLIEDRLEKVEDRCIRIIRSICNTKSHSHVNINEHEYGCFCFFVGLMTTRVPAFRNGIENMLRRLVEITGDQFFSHAKENSSLPELIDNILGDKSFSEAITVEVKSWASLEPMIEFATLLARSLSTKTCSFHYINTDPDLLITSCSPVSFAFPPKMAIGPMHPLAEVCIPLQKDYAAIFRPLMYPDGRDTRHMHLKRSAADSQYIKTINRQTAESSDRFMYASYKSDKLLRMLRKHKEFKNYIVVD